MLRKRGKWYLYEYTAYTYIRISGLKLHILCQIGSWKCVYASQYVYLKSFAYVSQTFFCQSLSGFYDLPLLDVELFEREWDPIHNYSCWQAGVLFKTCLAFFSLSLRPPRTQRIRAAMLVLRNHAHLKLQGLQGLQG